MKPPIKLKIELKDMPHKIVRKVLVPEDITMHQLHLIIQDSMGWHNAHLYEFLDAKTQPRLCVGIRHATDEEFNAFGMATKQDAFKTGLKDVFLLENDAEPFWYWYDFGDDWWHRISFLKTSQKDMDAYAGIPMCIDAIGKCPPEDSGGPWGYAEFLKGIKEDYHPEHEEIMEWYGLEPEDEYDETTTNLEKINFMLNDIYKSKHWKAKKSGDI